MSCMNTLVTSASENAATQSTSAWHLLRFRRDYRLTFKMEQSRTIPCEATNRHSLEKCWTTTPTFGFKGARSQKTPFGRSSHHLEGKTENKHSIIYENSSSTTGFEPRNFRWEAKVLPLHQDGTKRIRWLSVLFERLAPHEIPHSPPTAPWLVNKF